MVTDYRTVARTNGYAPTSQAQYYAEQRLENVSPALAEVSGDWTGPNADGTPNTWQFVGTARATSTTTITADSYTVGASAFSSYELNTTGQFIDPLSVSIFAPGCTAQYRSFFETDIPLIYAITAQLNQHGRVRLSQFGGPEVFDESNSSVATQFLHLSGTISPGRYQFLTGTSIGVPNLSNGIHHLTGSGGLANLFFTVQVPEPTLSGGIALAILIRIVLMRRITLNLEK